MILIYSIIFYASIPEFHCKEILFIAILLHKRNKFDFGYVKVSLLYFRDVSGSGSHLLGH